MFALYILYRYKLYLIIVSFVNDLENLKQFNSNSFYIKWNNKAIITKQTISTKTDLILIMYPFRVSDHWHQIWMYLLGFISYTYCGVFCNNKIALYWHFRRYYLCNCWSGHTIRKYKNTGILLALSYGSRIFQNNKRINTHYLTMAIAYRCRILSHNYRAMIIGKNIFFYNHERNNHHPSIRNMPISVLHP